MPNETEKKYKYEIDRLKEKLSRNIEKANQKELARIKKYSPTLYNSLKH